MQYATAKLNFTDLLLSLSAVLHDAYSAAAKWFINVCPLRDLHHLHRDFTMAKLLMDVFPLTRMLSVHRCT